MSNAECRRVVSLRSVNLKCLFPNRTNLTNETNTTNRTGLSGIAPSIINWQNAYAICGSVFQLAGKASRRDGLMFAGLITVELTRGKGRICLRRDGQFIRVIWKSEPPRQSGCCRLIFCTIRPVPDWYCRGCQEYGHDMFCREYRYKCPTLV